MDKVNKRETPQLFEDSLQSQGTAKMSVLVTALFAACALFSSVNCADSSVEWCYHLPSCNDTKWPVIASKYCNGTRQSPVDIVTTAAKGDAKLTEFTFHNFDSKSAFKTIENTGKTVKVNFNGGMTISGGGLSEPYDSLQLHLHWGNGSSIPGSEHTVDGKRYAMELHIVNVKSVHNLNVTAAGADSTGLAALGFFIEVMSGDATGQPASWKTLTSYLANITKKGNSSSMASGISLDDLLEGVNRTKYYRYLGSLTTPSCNEAVVWTVFKEPIKVSRDLIDLFSTTVHIGSGSSPLMVKIYRNLQPPQAVTTQASDSSSTTYLSMGLLALSLMLGRCY